MQISDVIKMYERCGSIAGTARQLHCSEGAVRKCLVTAGVYESWRLDQIRELLDQGLSPQQIAETLHISAATVNTYLAYSKGSYLSSEKTVNAARISACRRRKAEMRSEDEK